MGDVDDTDITIEEFDAAFAAGVEVRVLTGPTTGIRRFGIGTGNASAGHAPKPITVRGAAHRLVAVGQEANQPA